MCAIFIYLCIKRVFGASFETQAVLNIFLKIANKLQSCILVFVNWFEISEMATDRIVKVQKLYQKLPELVICGEFFEVILSAVNALW
jgi:hypothetical protein